MLLCFFCWSCHTVVRQRWRSDSSSVFKGHTSRIYIRVRKWGRTKIRWLWRVYITSVHMLFSPLLTVLVVYFFLACWAAGTAISSGLVVPMLWVFYHNWFLWFYLLQWFLRSCTPLEIDSRILERLGQLCKIMSFGFQCLNNVFDAFSVLI